MYGIYPAEVLQVREWPDDNLPEASVVAVSDDKSEVDGNDKVDSVDGDEERMSGL